MIDLVDAAEEFTVLQFQTAGRAALSGIAGRDHGALLVGGTGLYLRSVIDGLTFPGRYPEIACSLEQGLDAAGPDGSTGQDRALRALHDRLVGLDPVAAGRIDPSNHRRLVRALEVTIGAERPFSTFGPGLERYPPTAVSLVGIRLPPVELDRRIAERFDRLMELGFLDEVRSLAARPGRPVADGPSGSRLPRAAHPRRTGRACRRSRRPGHPPDPCVRPTADGMVSPRSPYRVVGARYRPGGSDCRPLPGDSPRRCRDGRLSTAP